MPSTTPDFRMETARRSPPAACDGAASVFLSSRAVSLAEPEPGCGFWRASDAPAGGLSWRAGQNESKSAPGAGRPGAGPGGHGRSTGGNVSVEAEPGARAGNSPGASFGSSGMSLGVRGGNGTGRAGARGDSVTSSLSSTTGGSPAGPVGGILGRGRSPSISLETSTDGAATRGSGARPGPSGGRGG